MVEAPNTEQGPLLPHPQRLDLFAWCVRLSRLSRFSKALKALHFHFISFSSKTVLLQLKTVHRLTCTFNQI